ncbi:hypothetical protein HK096_009198 [Nowakowskiella sp. JEL0078]|nr:hypothetical protein HK096_009198 [Nowakowskiella sp. JEL0078]
MNVMMSPRVMITVTLMLAKKFLEDISTPNTVWAYVSGIDTQTLNDAEREVLASLGYTLWLRQDEYDEWVALICRFSDFDSGLMAGRDLGRGKRPRVGQGLVLDHIKTEIF